MMLNKNLIRYGLNVIDAHKKIINGEYIVAKWWDGKPNIGDGLAPIIINRLTNINVINLDNLLFYNGPVLVSIGSILNNLNVKKAIVWGSGFKGILNKIKRTPQKIYLVRGPLTRNIIIKQNIECPEEYGDPALLCSKLFTQDMNSKYEVGIIPNIEDRFLPMFKNINNHDNYKLLDIQSPIPLFLKNLCSCKYIISSSLHGIIIADSYHIPSVWVNFSNLNNNQFKFLDYFESTYREKEKPILITKTNQIEHIINMATLSKIDHLIHSIGKTNPFNK